MAGQRAEPDQELIWLFQRALIMKEFPAYKLEDLDTAPVGELLKALELLAVARKVAEKPG